MAWNTQRNLLATNRLQVAPYDSGAKHDRFSFCPQALPGYRQAGLKESYGPGNPGPDLFFVRARCAACHQPPAHTDRMMHDLMLKRFGAGAAGPIKTFVLRGIKDSPHLYGSRLLTLENTVGFFNIAGGTRLELPKGIGP